MFNPLSCHWRIKRRPRQWVQDCWRSTFVKYGFANNIFWWDKFTECSVTALFCTSFWFSSAVVFPWWLIHIEYEGFKLRQWWIQGMTRTYVSPPHPPPPYKFQCFFFKKLEFASMAINGWEQPDIISLFYLILQSWSINWLRPVLLLRSIIGYNSRSTSSQNWLHEFQW